MSWSIKPRVWGSMTLLFLLAWAFSFGAAGVAAKECADDVVHVVQSGETLSGIAARYAVSVNAIMQANDITDANRIFVGQRLVIPAGGSAAAPATPPSGGAYASGTKRIEVDLTTQWMYAYAGDTLVWSSGVSSGRDGWETPTGTFNIYAKYPVQDMQGSAYGETWYVPGVPNVMYIFGGVALHGTYWHNAFGSGARLSHGCVNLPLDVAAALYDWAPMGTPVWVHY